jgi:hypothetical protein
MRVGNVAAMRRSGMVDMRRVWVYYPEPDRRPRAVLEANGFGESDEFGVRLGHIELGPPGVIGFLRDLVLGEQGFAPAGLGTRELLASSGDPSRDAALAAVLDEVFGDSADEQRLRRVIELVHLGPRRREHEYLSELHVSRTTWFRLLQTARERVLAHPLDGMRA